MVKVFNMLKKIKDLIEPNKKIRNAECAVLIVIMISALVSYIYGLTRINADTGNLTFEGETVLIRDFESEDYDEENTVCDVIFFNGEDQLIITYPYEEYENLDIEQITAYKYVTENGVSLLFQQKDPDQAKISYTYRMLMSNRLMPLFNLANALLILSVSILVVMLFSKSFTVYEKIWFVSIMVLATIFAVIFPEESANGINGIIIMLLYLLDTFLNILCELLISKQSRYNFLVSVAVEITEIVICIVLMYRFATMAVTLFFWLPIDIISYINWSKHLDEKEEELTVVRRLKGYQEVLIILAIIVWTVAVGYFLSGLDIATDFYNNDRLETIVTYIDACASAVGVANGLFIFFRLREQWIAWYICALLEAVINIMTGQYVLLILKLGYFTNTTYGYIKWSRYIRSHSENQTSLF